MKLNRNSWHAKLNGFIYGWSYVYNVDCLCPYFWGTILAGFLLPFWLLGHGIVKIADAMPETNIHFPTMSQNTKDKVGKGLGYGFICFMLTAITIYILDSIVEFGLIHVLYWFGVIAGIAGGIIGLIVLSVFLKVRYDDWRYEHPKKSKPKKKNPNLLVEFIKAKKDKHCPLVEWVD